MSTRPDEVGDALAEAFHREWGQIVATLIRVTGDWELSEDCAQDAFTAALRDWPVSGVPRRPGAWLTTTARNRAVDRLRRTAVGEAKLRELATLWTTRRERPDIPDDRLRLIFTCCHPALELHTRVALTLRTLTGLTTAQIARAFLVSEATMAKRLVRARQKIRHARIPYRVPPPELLPQRVPAVLAVLYLLFNEGYSSTTEPQLVNTDLCAEAVWLARVLRDLMPEEAEVAGLLALTLFHDSRRGTRTDEAGELVPLEEQDRSAWNGAQIGEATTILEAALAQGAPGPYQVQAAIAACHATAASPADTDWPQIAALYGVLRRWTDSPVVELNRAVAVGIAQGPAAGLQLLDALDTDLAGYHLYWATRADLLVRLGRQVEALDAYRRALPLAGGDTERRFLRRKIAENS